MFGVWMLPSGAGGIKSSQVDFVEYYSWNGASGLDCPDQPKTEVTFGFPTSSASGVSDTTGKPYDYSDGNGSFTFPPQHYCAV